MKLYYRTIFLKKYFYFRYFLNSYPYFLFFSNHTPNSENPKITPPPLPHFHPLTPSLTPSSLSPAAPLPPPPCTADVRPTLPSLPLTRRSRHSQPLREEGGGAKAAIGLLAAPAPPRVGWPRLPPPFARGLVSPVPPRAGWPRRPPLPSLGCLPLCLRDTPGSGEGAAAVEEG